MAEEADVLIAWNHGAIPPAVKPAFTRPTRFINLPNPDKWSQAAAEFGGSPVRGILSKYAPGVTPLRVALLGFSASCQGVAQVLGSSDGARIDSVVAVDGIHVGYVDKATKKINEAGMKPWLDFGKLAVVNERLFVITHSSVVPPGYASTTETANWLWSTLTSSTDPYAQDPPIPSLQVLPTSVTTSVNGPQRTVLYPEPPWKRKNRARGLVVLGCSNLDASGTTDHIYEAKAIMPAVLAALLAERWNAIDPKAPGQSCFIGGPPTHPGDFFMLGAAEQCATSVVLPSDYMQTKDAAPLPNSGIAPAAQFSTAKGIGVGTVVAVGALGLGALWWLAQRPGVLASNPRRSAGMTAADFDPEELERGTEHEMEHTDSRDVAERIAMDHLAEDPDYYEKLEAVLPNPGRRALPYAVRFEGDTAAIRYKSADDPKRVFELRVKAYETRGGSWDLYDPEGRRISGGTMGDFGSLNYARGPALPQTIDKAERVLRSTGIWGYTGPNKARWGVDQP